MLDQHKMAKHYELTIGDTSFAWRRKEDAIAAEAQLDGIYVIRTNVPKEDLTAEQTVATYKSLSQVERAFRCLKTIDLEIRPIHHWLAPRVRAHVFLCMLAYYVEFHMRSRWPRSSSTTMTAPPPRPNANPSWRLHSAHPSPCAR